MKKTNSQIVSSSDLQSILIHLLIMPMFVVLSTLIVGLIKLALYGSDNLNYSDWLLYLVIKEIAIVTVVSIIAYGLLVYMQRKGWRLLVILPSAIFFFLILSGAAFAVFDSDSTSSQSTTSQPPSDDEADREQFDEELKQLATEELCLDTPAWIDAGGYIRDGNSYVVQKRNGWPDTLKCISIAHGVVDRHQNGVAHYSKICTMNKRRLESNNCDIIQVGEEVYIPR